MAIRKPKEPGVTSADLSFQYSKGGEVYPFVEGEDAEITGWGHQDKAAFVAAVNRYDREVAGDDAPEALSPNDVSHGWGIRVGDYIRPTASSAPGSFPITTIWGVR